MKNQQIGEEELLDLKKKIEKAKISVSELKGQQKSLMNQLKTEYGCTTIEQAEKKLASIDKEIAGLDKEINDKIEVISKKYNFEE